jgi:hypothetical protein
MVWVALPAGSNAVQYVEAQKMGASFEAPKLVPHSRYYCTVKVSEVKCFTLPEVPITTTV